MGWREDVRDGYVTTAEAFMADNPTEADRVYRARPESVADTRSIFVGTIAEQISLDSGTWGRVVLVDLVCAIHLSDNAETTDKLEAMADGLIEWLAADDRAHCLGAHTEQHPVRSATIELAEGPILIPAITVTCQASILQGRT